MKIVYPGLVREDIQYLEKVFILGRADITVLELSSSTCQGCWAFEHKL